MPNQSSRATKNLDKESENNTRLEYSSTEKSIITTGGFIDLAYQVEKRFQEPAWVKRLYEKAAERVKSAEDLRKIARSLPGLRDFLGDQNKEFEKSLYLRALEKTRTKAEYILYAQLISFFLRDGEFSQELCANIEAIFLPKRTLEEEYKHIVEDIDNKSDQEKMEAFGQFLKKYKLNKYIKDIYFKVAREFARINKREALIAYLKYYQLTFKYSGTEAQPEPIPDRVKKTIFRHEKEYQDFMEIIEAMREDLDIGVALNQVNDRYRKKITLDKENIDGIKAQHAGTVEKLHAILDDESNDVWEANENRETTATDEQIENETATTTGQDVINWNEEQVQFLRLFAAPGYTVSLEQAAEFARERNLFLNQLINGINEMFFENNEDMLIEDLDEETYQINPEYASQALMNP